MAHAQNEKWILKHIDVCSTWRNPLVAISQVSYSNTEQLTIDYLDKLESYSRGQPTQM